MAESKKEKKLEIPLEGVKAKLQTARVMLLKKDLAKTGNNTFANFKFFQAKDFMPEVLEIFTNLGLYSSFNIMSEVFDYEVIENNNAIIKKPIIKEMATLKIIDIQKPDDVETYKMEVAPLEIGRNSKQNIYQAAGGRNTYYKRYLYMNALELTEDDEYDATLGQKGVVYNQQPQMTPYDFMPNKQAQSINSVPQNNNNVANNIKKPDTNINKGNWEPQNLNQVAETIEQATSNIINDNDPLSVESKFEIMNLVDEKHLDGSKILSDFCKQNGLSSIDSLLELHKQPLIDMINGIK